MKNENTKTYSEVDALDTIDSMIIDALHLENGCASSLIEDHLAEVRSHLYRIDGFLELNEAFEGAEEVEINDD